MSLVLRYIAPVQLIFRVKSHEPPLHAVIWASSAEVQRGDFD